MQAADRRDPIKRARQHLCTATAIVTLSLLLASCATVTATSSFEIDGAATHTLTLVIPRDAIPDTDLPRVQLALEGSEARATEDGLTVQHIETSTQLGVHISSSTKEATDAAAALNSLVNSLLGTPDTGPVALFQGTYERTNPAVGGNQFDLSLTVEGNAIRTAFSQVLPAASLQRDPEEIMTISYTVTMPGKIRQTNGEQINDSTVRWSIPLQGDTTMDATSSVGKDTPWAWIALTILAAIVVVMAITAVATMLLMSRRRAQRELALTDASYTSAGLRASIGRAVKWGINGTGPNRSRMTPPNNQERADGTDTERD